MNDKCALSFASKFSEASYTDKVFIDNNTKEGLLLATMEEAGEFVAAYGKYQRTLGNGHITPVSNSDAEDNLKCELADLISTAILCAEKLDWLDEILDRHKKKSYMCYQRIIEKSNQTDKDIL